MSRITKNGQAQKQRLLLVNDYEIGSGAEAVYRMSRELLDERFEVQTFVGADRIERARNPFAYLFSRVAYREFSSRLESFKPAIVHLHVFHHILSPSILKALADYKKRHSVAVFFTTHDAHTICPSTTMTYVKHGVLVPIDTPPGVLDVMRRRWDARGFPYNALKKIQHLNAYVLHDYHRVIDCVICPSNYFKQLFEQRHENVVLVRYPMDLQPAPPTAQAGVKATNPTAGLRMIFVGRLSFEKGLQRFIEALAEVSEFDYRFDIIGDGIESRNLARAAADERLRGRVRLVGRIERGLLAERLQQYHALVLPSSWCENSPVSLMEAAMMGLRLVTGNYGGMRETAEICGGEYLMDLGRTDHIRETLARCWADVRDERPIVRDLSRTVEAFSEQHYLESLTSLYERHGRTDCVQHR